MTSDQKLRYLVREMLTSLMEERHHKQLEKEDDGFTYDDGSGERQKYSDQDSMSGGMGAMMS